MSSLTPEGLGVDLPGLRLRGHDNDAERYQDFRTIANSSGESEHVPACSTIAHYSDRVATSHAAKRAGSTKDFINDLQVPTVDDPDQAGRR
ncbi:hypothetical protein KC356_g7045 [Hortaea werneckii]|nr:hypothetical protein KC356_g7045 [Hortaea werneckii]